MSSLCSSQVQRNDGIRPSNLHISNGDRAIYAMIIATWLFEHVLESQALARTKSTPLILTPKIATQLAGANPEPANQRHDVQPFWLVGRTNPDSPLRGRTTQGHAIMNADS